MTVEIDDKKCGASKDACKAIIICPTEAISYIEIEEANTDRNVKCSIDGLCGCECGCEETADCQGSPYGRIVIDSEKCIECGLCITECCGNAIEMLD